MNKITLYLLPFLSKSMNVYYFVLLPPLLAQHYITSAEVGYVGALSIAMLVLGALGVSRWHRFSSKTLVQMGAYTALACAGLLYLGIASHSLVILALAYAISGLQVGVSTSASNAIVGAYTKRGKRFTIMARMSMIGDLSRIVFPILVAGSLYLGGLTIAVMFIGFMSIAFIYVANSVPMMSADDHKEKSKPLSRLRYNRLFKYFISMEFLDSFASSQLFVFIPILFLAKGYSLQSTLLLQTAIFVGYLSGRWLMSKAANRFSGPVALAMAEFGMVVCIILLLLVNQLALLYSLTLLLGAFARGTAPVLRALVFDSLHDHQMKRGTAMHVVAGDSGSALGQLTFGLLLAWLGATVPFLLAAAIALVVVVLALMLANGPQSPWPKKIATEGLRNAI